MPAERERACPDIGVQTTGHNSKHSRLVRPILHIQSRHLTEVSDISGHQGRLMGHSDRCDQQIRATNLHEFLLGSQAVELRS